MVNPPFLKRFSREQRSPAVTKSGTLYYPMWLAYATGLLEHNGYDVKLIDCPANGYTWPMLRDVISSYKPNLLVLDTSTPSIWNDVEVGRKIKHLSPDTYLVLVGPHVSALPEATLQLNDSIDAVAVGEYDDTLLELAGALRKNSSPEDVSGLAVRFKDDIKRTGTRSPTTALDQIPFVSKVYKKHLNYTDYFYSHSRYPIVTIITSRGCPHRCVYCVYPQVFNGRNMRYRSIPNVVDEIEYILNAFPDTKEIMFEDDTFTLNKKRCFEFAEEIFRRRLKFSWSANARAEIDLETMKVLKRAGARLFCVGIESGCQEILDNIKKNLSISQIRTFFKDAKTAGIRIHGCFIVGNPGESKATLARTLAFAKELNPDTAQFFPIMVYPGTEAYDWAQKNGYLTTEDFARWLTNEGLHECVVSRPGLTSRDLVRFCDHARKEYYLRGKFIGSKIIDAIKNPSESKRLIRGGIKLSRYIMNG
jgi:radical SAM superfamily enzyme YgiQ (UPF0313 family)